MSDATEVSRHLPSMADAIDEKLTKLVGHRVAFSLFVWTDWRSNYISNVPRDQIAAVIKEHLKAWEAGMPDVPAHKIT